MDWSPESERHSNRSYEETLEDVRQAAKDAVDIAAKLGQDTDRFVTTLFIELLMAKQGQE
jgi:hypothetical protein